MKICITRNEYTEGWDFQIVCNRCGRFIGFASGPSREQTVDICRACAMEMYRNEQDAKNGQH